MSVRSVATHFCWHSDNIHSGVTSYVSWGTCHNSTSNYLFFSLWAVQSLTATVCGCVCKHCVFYNSIYCSSVAVNRALSNFSGSTIPLQFSVPKRYINAETCHWKSTFCQTIVSLHWANLQVNDATERTWNSYRKRHMLLHKLLLTLCLQSVVFRGHTLSARKNEWTLTSNNNSDLVWNFASDISCCAPVQALISRRNARNDELIVTNPSVVRQLSTNSLPIHRRPRATNCSDTKQLLFTRNQFPQQTLPKESHLQSPQSSEALPDEKSVYSFL